MPNPYANKEKEIPKLRIAYYVLSTFILIPIFILLPIRACTTAYHLEVRAKPPNSKITYLAIASKWHFEK